MQKLQDRARGKWRDILVSVGVEEKFLSSKHGPCPMCGGRDRFRFDNKAGAGTWICNSCGAGDGVQLVMRTNGLSKFADAAKLIEQFLPHAKVEAPKAERGIDPNMWRKVWDASDALDGDDPASSYLKSRGITSLGKVKSLRWRRQAKFYHDSRKFTRHPALVAAYIGPDGVGGTVEQQFLDFEGRKADLEPSRKMLPGPRPKGGAVRLCEPGETLGIAESVVTALSAAKLFQIPVWATLSAGAMPSWQPPFGVGSVVVFGDRDASYTGQAAAYALAHRLRRDGINVDVRIPDLEGDWNDVLMGGVSDEAVCGV